jgi:hypothetical protein
MRGPMPPIEFDNQDQIDLTKLSKEELDKIPFEKKKWICGCKNCVRQTTVRDYGLVSMYYWPAFKIWINPTEGFYMCPRHYKIWQRLIKSFDKDRVMQKYLDFEKAYHHSIK